MPSDRGTGGAAPDPAARRLREAAARFTERYEDILPPEVVAAVVWAAAEDVTGALPGGTEPAPDQVTQIVARAGADLAMAAGAPTHGHAYTPAEPTASAWTYLLDGVAVVRAIGEFDVYTGPVLGRELDRAAASGRRAVLVDLGRVSFMDLGGLAPLRAAAVDAAGGDHRLLLVQVPGPVQRLIDVSGAAGEMAAAAATGEVRRTG